MLSIIKVNWNMQSQSKSEGDVQKSFQEKLIKFWEWNSFQFYFIFFVHEIKKYLKICKVWFLQFNINYPKIFKGKNHFKKTEFLSIFAPHSLTCFHRFSPSFQLFEKKNLFNRKIHRLKNNKRSQFVLH